MCIVRRCGQHGAHKIQLEKHKKIARRDGLEIAQRELAQKGEIATITLLHASAVPALSFWQADYDDRQFFIIAFNPL